MIKRYVVLGENRTLARVVYRQDMLGSPIHEFLFDSDIELVGFMRAIEVVGLYLKVKVFETFDSAAEYTSLCVVDDEPS